MKNYILRFTDNILNKIQKIRKNLQKSILKTNTVCYNILTQKKTGVTCMYNVLDVCRYIVNYSNEKDYGISNLKLQKILYFVQAFFLFNSKNQQPCFHERIEAWDFGPVVREAYNEYKQFGSCNIPPIKSYTINTLGSWNQQIVNYTDDVISTEDKTIINQVLDAFKEHTANDLVEITHNQDPWLKAYRPYMNNEITNDSIREFFGNEGQ